MDKELYEQDVRGYALELIEERGVSADFLLSCALQWMSADQVREMLDANELSPRFDINEDEEDKE